MTVKECYEFLAADYTETLHRFGNSARMYKFLKMFLRDGSFALLEQSLVSAKYEEAFRAAHTLKGITANLGLKALFNVSVEITERLRPQVYDEGIDALFEKLKCEYEKTVRAIDVVTADEEVL